MQTAHGEYRCSNGNCKRKCREAGLKIPLRQGQHKIYADKKKACMDGRCYDIAKQTDTNESTPFIDEPNLQDLEDLSNLGCDEREQAHITKTDFSVNSNTGAILATITSKHSPANPKEFLASKGFDVDDYVIGTGKVGSWTTPMKIRLPESEGGGEAPVLVENFQLTVPFIPKKVDPIKFGLQIVEWKAEESPFHDHQIAAEDEFSDDGVERILVIPDIHFGYRTVNGVQQPTHDEKALKLTLELIHEYNPTLIVMLGDTMDFPEFGRHATGMDLEGNTLESLKAARDFFIAVREITNCPIHLLEGNHDKRPGDFLREELKKCAKVPGFDVKVPTIMDMLDLHDKGITYHGGYTDEGYNGYQSGASHFIHRDWAFMHGEKHGKDAVQQTMNLWKNHNICLGHIHKMIAHSEQVPGVTPSGLGYTRRWGISPGMLGVTDATLPGVNAVRNYQQGLSLITLVANDEDWTSHDSFVTQIPIVNGRLVYNHTIFSA